jgi:anti-anti-sigma regulatory factor
LELTNLFLRDPKGRVKLCNLQPGVVEIFHASRLDRVFSITEDVAEALRSF